MKISRNQLRRVIREQLLNEVATKSKMARHEAALKRILGDSPQENEDEARDKVSDWGGLSRGQRDELNQYITSRVDGKPKALAVDTQEEEEDALAELPEEGEDTDDEEEVEFSWDKKTWTVDDDKWPLTQGEHGEAVKKLQVAVGVEPDGYYGDITATAVAKYVDGNGETVTEDEHAELLAKQPGKGTGGTGGGGAPAEAEEEVEEQVEDHVEKIGRYIGTQAGATEDQMDAVVAIKRGYEENGSEGAMDAVAEIGTEYATDKLQGLLDDMEVELDADDLVGAAKGVWDSAFGTEEEKLSEGFYRRNRHGRKGGSVSRAQLRSMILREMLKRQ